MLDFYTAIKDRIQGRAEKGQRRSPEWRVVRKNYKKAFPTCFICDSAKRVEVHHIVPFNIAPDLELEPENLMSLCRKRKFGINCHLLVGHLGNFRRTNPNCKMDAMIWHEKILGYKG